MQARSEVLDVLAERYPNWIPRVELGNLSGFTVSGGTFTTYLRLLRRNEPVEV